MKPRDLKREVGKRTVNKRVGLKETPYRMRRSFRELDDETVQTIWAWYGTRCFTQAELAEKFDLSAGVVGAICRCMPQKEDRT